MIIYKQDKGISSRVLPSLTIFIFSIPALRGGVFVYEYADNQEKCISRKSKQGISIRPGTTRVTQMQEGGVLSYLIKRSVKCQVHFALGK